MYKIELKLKELEEIEEIEEEEDDDCIVFNNHFKPEEVITTLRWFNPGKFGKAAFVKMSDQEARETIMRLIPEIIDYHKNKAVGFKKNPYILEQYELLWKIMDATKPEIDAIKKIFDK